MKNIIDRGVDMKRLERGFVVSNNNIKGGVGKTTNTITIASVVAGFGFKTLLVDNDPQGSASSSLDMLDDGINIGDVLIGRSTVDDAIKHTNIDNLDIIQASLNVIKDEQTITEAVLYDRENIAEYLKQFGIQLSAEQKNSMPSYQGMKFLMRDLVDDLKEKYDFIFIDNSPYYSSLVENALHAADYILVPTKLDKTALEGYTFLLDMVKEVKAINKELKILGVIPNMYRHGTNLHKHVLEALKENIEAPILDPIPLTIKVEESPYYGETVTNYYADINASIVYIRNTTTILKNIFSENNIDIEIDGGIE